MAEQHWTPIMVEERIAEAVDTLRRLPEPRVQGYATTWPPIVRDYWESFGWDEAHVRPGPPSPAAIDRMDETLQWLHWLEPEDAKLVWARGENTLWKEICWRFGIGRTTAWQRWVVALCVIALKLNGERVPKHPARLRRLAQRMRRA
jgi:hypothetical protein